MPKLRVLSGKGVCKILAQNGFEKVRQKGSHTIMQKQQGHTTVPDLDELKTGTLLRVIRQSELPRLLFETK